MSWEDIHSICIATQTSTSCGRLICLGMKKTLMGVRENIATRLTDNASSRRDLMAGL